MFKVCSRCKQEKPVSSFWKVWTGNKRDKPPSDTTRGIIQQSGNYQRYCKDCCLEWQEVNKDKYILYQQRYRENKKNSEEITGNGITT